MPVLNIISISSRLRKAVLLKIKSGNRSLIIHLFFIALSVCGFFYPSRAAAHEIIGSVSNSIITVEGQTVNYYLNIPPGLFFLMEQFVGAEKAGLFEYFTDSIQIAALASDCRLSKLDGPVQQPSGNRIFHAVFECPQKAAGLMLTSNLFFDFDEKHLQFARIADADEPGNFLHEAVLSVNSPVFHVVSLKTGGSVMLNRAYQFFILGVEHLLTGYDHILFLCSAILVITTFMTSLKVITSFTAAHSLTLAMAFTGFISLPSSIVEPLIALSIVYVAIENVVIGDFSKRWIVTFFFGLVHGLGFVGALREITVSKAELLTSIIAFNIGIEAGQVLVIGVFFLLIRFIGNRPWKLLFQQVTSAIIGIAGFAWFIERILS